MRRLESSIDGVLDQWPYDPDALTARVIEFADGRHVLQIRIDMGVLQLELEGRPDGQRPEGYPSWLDCHLAQFEAYRSRHGTPAGFKLDPAACELLRDEATQVYQRYVVLHHLGRHHEVARDTARNLRCADFLKRHAERAEDSWAIEQYRPYIVMMNALARSAMYVGQHDYTSAERVLNTATATITAFANEHSERIDASRELGLLADQLRLLHQERPRSDAELLQRQLEEAVADEDYERAARLRDELKQAVGDLPDIWE